MIDRKAGEHYVDTQKLSLVAVRRRDWQRAQAISDYVHGRICFTINTRVRGAGKSRILGYLRRLWRSPEKPDGSKSQTINQGRFPVWTAADAAPDGQSAEVDVLSERTQYPLTCDRMSRRGRRRCRRRRRNREPTHSSVPGGFPQQRQVGHRPACTSTAGFAPYPATNKFWRF
jgi:hypothetical protein